MTAFPKPTPRERKPPKGLKRTGFLPRKTRLNARRVKERRTSQVRDEAWKAAVRELPCCAPGAPRGCWWAPGNTRRTSDPSHTATDHGLGQKGNDRKTIPHCRGHHDQWEFKERNGVFAGWSKDQRAEYAARMVARAEAAIQMRRVA